VTLHAEEIIDREKLLNHDFDEIIVKNENNTYISYTDFRQTIAFVGATPSSITSAMTDKSIRFDTADELYRFSVDVSYHPDHIYQTLDPSQNVKLPLNIREVLLDLDYVLGNDIDYSVMRSRQFIPIGFQFSNIEAETFNYNFTGTFDGHGYEISNLYFAGYNLITTVEGEGEAEIDTVLSPYYAMFTQNEGVIRNVGLINPTYELQSEHEDINKAANLVGLNKGLVENVYVIDNRENIYNAGIRMRAPIGVTSTSYSAAGIVYHNQGIFRHAYYVSRVVVNASFINNFSVQPVVYINEGTTSQLVYDSTVYQLTIQLGASTYQVTTPNSFAAGETTQVLRNSSSLGSSWYYYPQDRYPALWGLDYVDGKYEINDARDFVTFSRLMYLNTVRNNQVFRDADYVLKADIDMSEFARAAYDTSQIEFSGSLSGLKEDGGKYTVHHLHLVNGVLISSTYYGGLFSVLKGSVEDIIFANSSLTINDSEEYYGLSFYIGLIAGKLEGGSINNVLAQVDINLGVDAIGSLSVGALVGQAYGVMMGVYAEGTLNAGIHTFKTGQQADPIYNIGGIVGSTDTQRLTLYNALSKMSINSIGTSASVTTARNGEIRLGGVIGYVENASISHDLGLLTNEGTLVVNQFLMNNTMNQYVSGVIGLSRGSAYLMHEYYGLWTNKGLINATNAGTNYVTASGVVVSNHNEQVEYLYLFNEGNYTTSSYSRFNYTSLVYDLSTSGVILSQSKNTSSYEIVGNYNFSGVYYSANNAPSLLRYVENSGDILYRNQAFSNERSVAGISLSTNISYLNVIYSGNLTMYGITSSNVIWMAGITQILSPNHYLKASLNEGKMTFANINISNNAYIAGLVNRNLAGNLHNQDTSSMPRATTGILSSVNYADITSIYNDTINSITGNGNTYVGGIVTLNGGPSGGSIQDSLNMGNIRFANTNPFTDLVYFEPNANEGGLVRYYYHATILGGIAASTANGLSRIYDTANSGEIIAVSRNFSRAGGILGLTLYQELAAGNVSSTLFNNSATINANFLENSILANGINYGNVASYTSVVINYNTTTNATGSLGTYRYYTSSTAMTNSVGTREGTLERPGIYASAGGVIGYGLSVMRRMINHGKVSSTDVAGGIVGATFVYRSNQNTITVVHIDTAINYGSIRAFKTSNFSNIDEASLIYEDFEAYFYAVDDPFIFPNSLRNDNSASYFPEDKRGIGGIFGRLQRGQSRRMSAVGGTFDFIVNMDPNVDLIGRLDQVTNFTSSNQYFIFSNVKYYSARINDTTQAIFTGFDYIYRYSSGSSNRPVSRVFNRVYNVKERDYYYRTGNNWYRQAQVLRENRTETEITGNLYRNYSGSTGSLVSNNQTRVARSRVTGSNWVNVGSAVNLGSSGNYQQYQNERYIQPVVFSQSQVGNNTNESASYYFILENSLSVPLITENPNQTYGEFVYGASFEMRNDNTILSNGEPITSYIYYVENEVLSDRFRNEREYGMYVLSTSSGSSFGSALPVNIQLDQLYRLEGYLPYDTNYESIPLSDKNPLPQTIITHYQSLFQTRFNDKSELLTDNQNVELLENGGSYTHLITPTINHAQRRITFTLRLNQINQTQQTLSYRISDILLPENAIAGARFADADVGTIEELRALLYQEHGQSVSTLAPAALSINIGQYQNISSQTTVQLGSFVSYSESAISLNALMRPEYYTTYDIYLTIQPRVATSANSPRLYQYQRDSNSAQTPSQPVNYPFTISSGNTVSNQLRLTFRDPSSVLTLGYHLNQYVSLYYGSEQVDPAYYTWTTTALVTTNRQFTATLLLSNELRSGQYSLRYKYFYNDVEKTINFTKAASNVTTITNIDHYSSGAFTGFSGAQYTSELNFDYDLLLDSINLSTSFDDTKPSYLDNRTDSVSFLTNFETAPFSTLVSASYYNVTYSNGYRTYEIRYVVEAENGLRSTYRHFIRERTISIENVYRNNNRVPTNNVFTTREDELTVFALDYGIDPSLVPKVYQLQETNPNQYFEIVVSARRLNGTVMPAGDITGITYSADNFLTIFMTDETLPGNYTFTINYVRNGRATNLPLLPGSNHLVIRKNAGISAYLLDVRFTESALESDYADIFVSNQNGIPITSEFEPRIYYAGIDYDYSDVNGVIHYRINGQVSNIPLDFYTPFFLDYLPMGSTISRKVYPIEHPTRGWTTEANNDSSAIIKSELATDFTIIPSTGQEPTEEEDVVITYRITSEDGSNVVYYHINVIDILYNVSLVFNFYYEDELGNHTPAEHSELAGKTILVSVINFNTEHIVTSAQYETVDLFPTFTQVNSKNNQIPMFYLPLDNPLYRYRYGRNMSGFFAFVLNLPKDPNGNDYTYEIEFRDLLLNDINDYVSGLGGKYFYIGGGTKNRTRSFNVFIKRTNSINDPTWGLTDGIESWKKVS
ncbi:MAG: hypothetical protein WC964_02885, partial [Acholeplasmataceae bacterium]